MVLFGLISKDQKKPQLSDGGGLDHGGVGNERYVQNWALTSMNQLVKISLKVLIASTNYNNLQPKENLQFKLGTQSTRKVWVL